MGFPFIFSYDLLTFLLSLKTCHHKDRQEMVSLIFTMRI
jgi:hypothetical protein